MRHIYSLGTSFSYSTFFLLLCFWGVFSPHRLGLTSLVLLYSRVKLNCPWTAPASLCQLWNTHTHRHTIMLTSCSQVMCVSFISLLFYSTILPSSLLLILSCVRERNASAWADSQYILLIYGEMSKSFWQVLLSGKYTFLYSCARGWWSLQLTSISVNVMNLMWISLTVLFCIIEQMNMIPQGKQN